MPDEVQVAQAAEVSTSSLVNVVNAVEQFVSVAQKYLPTVITILEFLKHFNVGAVMSAPPDNMHNVLVQELRGVADKIQPTVSGS